MKEYEYEKKQQHNIVVLFYFQIAG